MRLLPKAETPPQTPPVSQKYKVLVCDRGKAEGTTSPTPGPRRQEEGPCSGRQGTSLVPRGREERAYQPPGGAGKTHAVLGRKEPKKKLAAWSPTGVEWDRGILNPCEGEEGKLERPWETQRMGQPLRRLFLRTCRPARVAISNTSRTPSLVLAEHSR